jgi:prepilin-type N-terminal cleavage/methylation domain-containing protein
MSRMNAGRARGFTFIEMIACFALIAMLAAMLLPVFARARESARRTACASNVHQLGRALHLYAQDYNGRFPPESWTDPLNAYVKNQYVYACASEPERSRQKYHPGRPGRGAGGAEELFSSYQYRPGLANDDPSTLPLMRDWEPWHFRGVNVLYLGGNTRWEPAVTAPKLDRGPRPAPVPGSVPEPEPEPSLWGEE